jgi:hypothetical protein
VASAGEQTLYARRAKQANDTRGPTKQQTNKVGGVIRSAISRNATNAPADLTQAVEDANGSGYPKHTAKAVRRSAAMKAASSRALLGRQATHSLIG